MSLYFAVYTLTSVGYGDITATNRGEFITCTCLMAFSAVVWAYTVGNFCSIVSSMDKHGDTFRQGMVRMRFISKLVPRVTERRCTELSHCF